MSGRSYLLRADSEDDRDAWVRVLVAARERADLVRKSFMAAAMHGPQRLAQAVGLIAMAREWEDLMMVAAGGGAAFSAPAAGPGAAEASGGLSFSPPPSVTQSTRLRERLPISRKILAAVAEAEQGAAKTVLAM